MWSALVLLSVIGCALAGPPVTRSRKDIESFKAFLERSRQEDGIRLESRMLANPKASVWENSGKYQGDILLSDKQAEMMLQEYAQGRNAGQSWPNTRWPTNTIVYEFSRLFTAAQIEAIHAAMEEISANTCIRFRRREPNEYNYVRISGRRNHGCYATVGYGQESGVHYLNLERDTPGQGCFQHTVIIHEWLHVIGFFHMQSTYNRDDYIRIMWQNIRPGLEHNFDKEDSNTVHNMGLPYEYASNMHYGRYAGSNDGSPTMLPIYDDKGLMGQQEFVTGWDWLRANRLYNCPGAWSAEINAEELSKGVSYEYEYVPEDGAVAEHIQEEVAEDMPQEEVLVADMPQEEIFADEVSFVDDAPQAQY